MSSAVISIEGVLRDRSGRKIIDGVKLLMALAPHYRVVVASESHDTAADEMWLRLEGIKGHQEVLPSVATSYRGNDRLSSQVEHLRAFGHLVDLIVDVDPGRIAHLMSQGYLCLLFAHPQFARPEFRPDFEREPRPWDDLAAEIEMQHYMKSQLPEQGDILGDEYDFS